MSTGTLAKLRQALQSVLQKELDNAGSGRDGHLGSKDLLSLAAAIGELAHINTDWVVELKYPHWSEPHYERREEGKARSLARYHRDRGAQVRLLKQEIYAGSQTEVKL